MARAVARAAARAAVRVEGQLHIRCDTREWKRWIRLYAISDVLNHQDFVTAASTPIAAINFLDTINVHLSSHSY